MRSMGSILGTMERNRVGWKGAERTREQEGRGSKALRESEGKQSDMRESDCV